MKFEQVVGQSEIKEKLKLQIDDKKIPHAQMFTGKEGSGTLPMALAYTQYLMCTNKTADSCGKCPACIKNQLLAHPDVYFIFPNNTNEEIKSKPYSELFLNHFRNAVTQNPYLNLNDWYNEINIGNKQGIINQNDSSSIMKQHSLKPYEAEYKVFIIWMAEKMNNSFANKILKVLEEPSDNSIFILISEDTENMLSTILSRVQQIHFPPVAFKEICNFLMKKYGLSEQKAEEIALLSENNVRKAILAATDNMNNELSDLFIEWMRLCYSFNIEKIIAHIETINKLKKEQIKELLNIGLHIFSNSLKIKYLPVEMLHLPKKQQDFIQKFHPFIHSENIDKIYDLFNESITGIERNANVKIILLDTSLRMKILLKKPEKVL